MLKLEGFTFKTSLDLNIGYDHIELTPSLLALCTIFLPWGKYEYLKLPMELCHSPDIFQEMGDFLANVKMVRAYIDDLLVITKDGWNNDLSNLNIVLHRLNESGLKINIDRSFFGKH